MDAIVYPTETANIQRLLERQERENPDLFGYWDRYSVEEDVYSRLSDLGFDKPHLKTSEVGKSSSPLMDAYSIHRASTQVNEACNKLWATVELANVVSPRIWHRYYSPLGKQFDGQFLLGTLIPALYYSQLSAIVSALSSFGCVSIRSHQSRISYNLVRTRKGWRLFERKKYINDALGDVLERRASSSWHDQLTELLYGFEKKLEEFPQIDYEETVKLQNQRNIVHYDILGEVSAKNISGIDQYFSFLPLVVNTISVTFDTLDQVCKLTSASGASRFMDLRSSLPKLYRRYKKRFPKEDFIKTISERAQL